MARFTNKTINEALTDLRKGLRTGTVKVTQGDLRSLVAIDLGIGKDDFNTENFNPQTLKRLAHLFENVPMKPRTGTTQIVAMGYPSQDDYAWALQNFMNRRADPWKFRRDQSVLAVETRADGIN